MSKLKKVKFKIFSSIVLAVSVLLIGGAVNGVSANSQSYGVDNSVYQGSNGRFGKSSDQFNIAQIGGIYNNSVKYQSTYNTQVQYTIATARRAHTYIFLADGANISRTQTYVAQMLGRVQTPKGSIVAIDYESGASGSVQGNTDNILTAMNMIKQAGYIPMFYSYKPYLQAYVDSNRILAQYPNSLWISSYKTSKVQQSADFNYFPTFNGVAIWQFADNYGAGNVDGNVDLLNITKKGYDGTTTSAQGGKAVVTDSSTQAIKAGQQANNTPKSDISKGYVVKVNYSAKHWATGQSIPNAIKGQSYTVAQVSGSRILLNNVNSWINRSDVEILATNKPATYTVSVDGYMGSKTILGLQKRYGMRWQDSKLSAPSALVKVMQKHLGVKQDGYMGPHTIKAMERVAGVTQDGYFSNPSSVVKYMQRSINGGVKPF